MESDGERDADAGWSQALSDGRVSRTGSRARISVAHSALRRQLRRVLCRVLALLPEQARRRRSREFRASRKWSTLPPRRRRWNQHPSPCQRGESVWQPFRFILSFPATSTTLVAIPQPHISSISPHSGADPRLCDPRFDTQDGLYDLAWSEVHENQIATASGDGSVKLWDLMLNVSTLTPSRSYHSPCCDDRTSRYGNGTSTREKSSPSTGTTFKRSSFAVGVGIAASKWSVSFRRMSQYVADRASPVCSGHQIAKLRS